MASLTVPLGKQPWLGMLGSLSSWSLSFWRASPALLIQCGTRVLSTQKRHVPVGKHFTSVCFYHTCFVLSHWSERIAWPSPESPWEGAISRHLYRKGDSLGPLLLRYTSTVSLISEIHFNQTNTGPNFKFLIIVSFMFLQNPHEGQYT